jgi:hypothetical protein
MIYKHDDLMKLALRVGEELEERQDQAAGEPEEFFSWASSPRARATRMNEMVCGHCLYRPYHRHLAPYNAMQDHFKSMHPMYIGTHRITELV